jgi:transcriptional regulator with XRE-family HTH domain
MTMNVVLSACSDEDLEMGDLQDVPSAQAAGSKKVDKVDQYVGLRIRERRLMMGLSQSDLAGKIGVTYQQAHKYERGVNRISAGRLAVIATALSTEPAWFFEGFETAPMNAAVPKRQRQLLELMRNFELMQDPKQQQAICTMARVMAGKSEGGQ